MEAVWGGNMVPTSGPVQSTPPRCGVKLTRPEASLPRGMPPFREVESCRQEETKMAPRLRSSLCSSGKQALGQFCFLGASLGGPFTGTPY